MIRFVTGSMERRFSKYFNGAVGRVWIAGLLGCLCLWAGAGRALAISVGDRVQTIDKDNIRATPAGTFLTTRQYGVVGTVLEGPVVATLNGIVLNWFRVDFDAGIDGWVAEVGLASISIPPGIPTNPKPGIQTSPGVVVTNSTVTLNWPSVPEATYYDLGVFDTSTGAAAVNTFVDFGTHAYKITNDTITIMVGYTVTLTPGREYRWTVASGNPVGFSAYTPVLYFQTPEVPPPVITAAPQNVTAIVGTSPSFHVAATGTALAYQWRRAGTNLVGQTNATLTLTNVTLPAAGFYSVVVANVAGVATGGPALLTVASCVVQPPALQALAEIRSHGFTLDVLVELGRSFRVQASADMQAWTDVTNFTSTAPTWRVVDFAGRNGNPRFYRVLSP